MLLLARTLKKSTLKWLDWEACESCHATVLTRLLWPKMYRQPESFTFKIAVFVRPRIFKWQWM